MNKKEALNKLDALEKEASELREIINREETLMERVKTYSDVCKELNIEELKLKDFNFLPKNQQKKALAFSKIQNIVELFNEGWEPDWADSVQKKYYPYFDCQGSFRFGDFHYLYYSFRGEAGFYKNKELAIYCGKQFQDIYKDLL